MSQPFFSIITCTYNSEKHLAQSIASVREQDFDDYEHVFIDAFSTDGTVAMIEAYAKEDPRVRIVQDEPKGISNAMSRGVLEARGKVVQHLHGDDYYHSGRTLSIVHEQFMKHPKKTMVIGMCSRIYEDGSTKSGILPASTFKRRKALLKYLIHVNCYIAHPSTFIKKEVFDRHGVFDDSIKIAMDYEYWLRMLGKESYVMINEELTTFRSGGNSSSDLEATRIDEDKVRKMHSKGFRPFIARNLLRPAVLWKERRNELRASVQA